MPLSIEQQVEELSRDIDIREVSFKRKYKERLVKDPEGGDPKLETYPVDFVSWTTVGEHNKAKTEFRVRDLAPQKAGSKRGQHAIEWPVIEPLYEAWCSDCEMQIEGTPLDAFAALTPEDITYLKQEFAIHTCEQLAAMKEGQITSCHLPGARQLVTRAKAFLDARAGDATLDAALRSRDEKLAAQEAAMTEQAEKLKAMEAMLAQLSSAPNDEAEDDEAEPAKRGPGRPRKAQ